MALLGTQLKLGKLCQIVALCLVQISLFFGLAILDFGSIEAQAQPLSKEAASYPVEQEMSKPLDLDKAANKANQASEKIFEGKDETKNWMGEKEPTNQAIEYGRAKASEKWKSIADKAQSTKNSDESLSIPEKVVLDQFTRGN